MSSPLTAKTNTRPPLPRKQRISPPIRERQIQRDKERQSVREKHGSVEYSFCCDTRIGDIWPVAMAGNAPHANVPRFVVVASSGIFAININIVVIIIIICRPIASFFYVDNDNDDDNVSKNGTHGNGGGRCLYATLSTHI